MSTKAHAPAQATDQTTPAPAAAPAVTDPALSMQSAGGGGNAAVADAMKRQLLPGGRVLELDLDAAAVLTAFEDHWASTCEQSGGFLKDKCEHYENGDEGWLDFDGSPVEGEIAGAVSGMELAAKPDWDSGWVDDGADDRMYPLADAEVRATMKAWLDGATPVAQGPATFGAKIGSSAGAKDTAGTEVGASASGGGFGLTGKSTQGHEDSTGSSGENSVGMQLTSTVLQGGVTLECGLQFRTLSGEQHETSFAVAAGTAFVTSLAGA